MFRNIWISIAVGYVVDAVVALVVFSIISPNNPWLLTWSLLAPIAIYIVQLVWSGYSMLKRYIWYRLFEKEKRIAEMVQDFERKGFPAPEEFYNDVDDYLTQAANEESMPADVRFSSALILGILTSQRQVGPRGEALLTNVILEEAIAKYGRTHIPVER